jgi:hypothetical protein
MSKTGYTVTGLAGLAVSVLVGATCLRIGERDEENKLPIVDTYAVKVVADRLGMPRCIRLPADVDLPRQPICTPLWFSPDIVSLTLGERVWATYVDAVLEDGSRFEGYVITPRGRPAG